MTASDEAKGRRVKRGLQLASALLTAAAIALLMFLPVYSGSSETVSDGTTTVTNSSETLLQVNGMQVLIVLAVPLVASALPLFARGRAWPILSVVSAAALGFFVVVGSMTIGSFFVPALILSIVAACLPPTRRELAGDVSVRQSSGCSRPAQRGRRVWANFMLSRNPRR